METQNVSDSDLGMKDLPVCLECFGLVVNECLSFDLLSLTVPWCCQ